MAPLTVEQLKEGLLPGCDVNLTKSGADIYYGSYYWVLIYHDGDKLEAEFWQDPMCDDTYEWSDRVPATIAEIKERVINNIKLAEML